MRNIPSLQAALRSTLTILGAVLRRPPCAVLCRFTGRLLTCFSWSQKCGTSLASNAPGRPLPLSGRILQPFGGQHPILCRPPCAVLCTFAGRLPGETTSEPSKVVRSWCGFNILTSKCASRHSGVRFFDNSTSKSARSMVCFVHFDLEVCFAPRRRALFRHLNF